MMRIENKTVHLSLALATILVCVVSAAYWPDLRKDAPTTFGTLSGFATLYGVIFTIIELIRTKNAAERAANEASNASAIASTIFDSRDISECMSVIEHIVEQLNQDGRTSSALILRVVKMYSSQFHAQISDHKSQFRQNLDAVEAYSFSLRARDKAKQHANLERALVNMTSQLASALAAKNRQVIP